MKIPLIFLWFCHRNQWRVINQLIGSIGRFTGGNEVLIDSDWVRGLEQANLLSTQQATSFLLGVTTLHEYVHLARFANGLPAGDKITVEYGWWFEYKAFGAYIFKENAYKFTFKMFQK
jgi:hypothetical protein